MENGQITVTITGNNLSEVSTNLNTAAKYFAEDYTARTGDSMQVGSLGKGTARRAKAPEPVEDEEEISRPRQPDDADTTFTDDENDGKDDADEQEAEEEPASKFTLNQVKSALKTYASKGAANKEKAMKLLKKYGVKHVDDLAPTNFEAMIKALK